MVDFVTLRSLADYPYIFILRIESLNKGQLDWMTSHVSSIPVIACVGESEDGRLGLVQLDEGAHALSAYTKPLKVLLLNANGGINDHKGQVCPYSSLSFWLICFEFS